MTTITDKKQYPGEQYLNELITNIEFAARAPVEVVRAMAAELQKRREADSAEPVSQTYKSQHTQFEQVADLYEMQFDDGRTCAFHTDAQKAAQWLQACDGNRVQEYVKLERLRNALSGNYPVTPDGWISCSDRMPEMGERQYYVLAADFKNNYPPSIPNTQVGVYGDWFNDGNPTWDDGDGEDLHLKEVTHWMPLPEPPKEA
ncbi:DUF551 domain-containing protein [Escherichia coli]|uniref:DUF551 domain-containing protein n=2 Tax=Escherichia coli TaxID=562 RepID=UPI002665DF78|nr:DUF551 domain-containing protein [Escherichia coli]MDO2726976.1 DUF551 domain-containing protein [Escherichia coli]